MYYSEMEYKMTLWKLSQGSSIISSSMRSATAVWPRLNGKDKERRVEERK